MTTCFLKALFIPFTVFVFHERLSMCVCAFVPYVLLGLIVLVPGSLPFFSLYRSVQKQNSVCEQHCHKTKLHEKDIFTER